jgi:formamidopyrimidine-DNA glycosylase
MAELPYVAILRPSFDATALHQEIAGSEIRDDQMLDGLTAAELDRGLVGHAIATTRRHGKYLFALLDDQGDGALVLHFGMTGSRRTFKRSDAMPEYARVLIRFTSGYRLAVVSQRLLGGVAQTDDADAFVADRGLGWDALDDRALAALFWAMHHVLETAVERDADPAEFPSDWITRHHEHGATCPRRGGEIERLEVSGRGTYWWPACQGGAGAGGGGGA